MPDRPHKPGDKDDGGGDLDRVEFYLVKDALDIEATTTRSIVHQSVSA